MCHKKNTIKHINDSNQHHFLSHNYNFAHNIDDHPLSTTVTVPRLGDDSGMLHLFLLHTEKEADLILHLHFLSYMQILMVPQYK